MDHGRKLIGAVAAIAGALALLLASSASAATFPVTNTSDAGPGSLRDAITQADTAGGSNVIDATAISGSIELQTALPELESPIEIRGPGADELIVRRDPLSGVEFRVFHFEVTAPATVSGLTVGNGGADIGGGIRADDALTLDDVVVRESAATLVGGGVFAGGALTVRDSTITANIATGVGGGGIYSESFAPVDIARSTISGNSAEGSGAGLRFQGGAPIAIRNSTITGNSVASNVVGGSGGGVFMNAVFADLQVSNSTVAANAAPAGSNLDFADGDSVTVRSSIVSNPLGAGLNCRGAITSDGFNIASDASCNLNDSTDQPETDPDLGPLEDNGGPTLTMAPSASSPAIDQGSFGAEPRDQRGLDRPVDMAAVANAAGGLGVDVGAVEVQTSEVPAPTASITSGPTGAAARPTFAFTAANAREVECSIDQGTPSYGPCTSASSHTPASDLADGSWIFRVRAVAITGAEAVDSVGFVVDTSAPTVTVDSGPVGPNGDTTPTFSFSASEPATFACRVYRQGTSPPAFGACSGPGQSHTPASPLGDGAYTFEVRATDGAGNSAASSRAFTVDAAAPSVSVDSGPSGPTADPTPTFAFSAGGETVPFACRISPQGGAIVSFAACSGPGASHTATAALADGTYTLEVRATDASGNQGSAARTFTVDTAPPAPSIDSGPRGRTTDATPIFSFSANESATFECRLGPAGQGGPFGACTGPGQTHSSPALADGTYTLEVRATDAAGNQATTTRALTLTAGACRQALSDVISASAGVAAAKQNLRHARGRDDAKALKKAKKALKKAKRARANATRAFDRDCVNDR